MSFRNLQTHLYVDAHVCIIWKSEIVARMVGCEGSVSEEQMALFLSLNNNKFTSYLDSLTHQILLISLGTYGHWILQILLF